MARVVLFNRFYRDLRQGNGEGLDRRPSLRWLSGRRQERAVRSGSWFSSTGRLFDATAVRFYVLGQRDVVFCPGFSCNHRCTLSYGTPIKPLFRMIAYF